VNSQTRFCSALLQQHHLSCWLASQQRLLDWLRSKLTLKAAEPFLQAYLGGMAAA
jgi:hypothetical protein